MAPYHIFLYVTAQINSRIVYTQTTRILFIYELSNEELSSVYSKSSIENSWVIWVLGKWGGLDRPVYILPYRGG